MIGSERYKRLSQIQNGTFGSVWRCQDLAENKEVAMKECEDCIFTKQEISALQAFDHPYIIKLLDKYNSDYYQYLIMELAGIDLQEIIEKGKPSPEKTKKYMKCLLEALKYIHEKGFIHRDIKPANICIQADDSIKLIDFGSCVKKEKSQESPPTLTNQFCSIDYLLGAPEITEKFDMWSAGCVLGQMLTGKVLFDGEGQIAIIHEIIKILGTPQQSEWPEMKSISYFEDFSLPEYQSTLKDIIPEGTDPLAVDLLKKLLSCSESRRLSAAQALAHPYFQN